VHGSNLYGLHWLWRKFIDWDYTKTYARVYTHLHVRACQLFLWWRQDGSAFEIRDAKVPQPNRSLASYAEGKVCVRESERKNDCVSEREHAILRA